ncbi:MULTISPECIES: hypothetical protein [Bradyrhizobium]|uniref:hypothetical protein n=1 Tax=Bradyrhizobium australafricanum TaxID=2821406 RepID=UPI001CE24219|nr:MULTISPECIES: hypothetical protein [Bradyrhizobium]
MLVYPTGTRGRDWVKKTCVQRETLTFAGFALDESAGRRQDRGDARAERGDR